MYKFNEIKRPLVITAIVLGIIILIVIASRSCKDEKVVSYQYETVAKGSVKKTISASGSLEVDRLQVVLAKTSGIVFKVHVGVNQPVKKGQVIISLDSVDIDRDIKKFRAEYDIMKDQMEKEKRELENSKNMFKENLISRQSLENQEFQYRTVLNRFKKTKIDYDILLEKKRDTRILAPIDGVIVEYKTAVNQPVRENADVFTIAPTMKKMLLRIDVDESDIGFVEKNQQASFSVSAYPDISFPGKLIWIAISPIRKGGIISYKAAISCDNNDLKLKPGMTAAATVIVSKKENVLRILNQAFIVSPTEIAMEQQGKFVWKKTPNIIGGIPMKKIPVKSGLVGDMYTEILSGLKPGDKVLIRIVEEKK